MSLISAAKTKAARGSVKEAFKNEAGAIDLASIMVGIIVIGLIGGVIAATVFAVIPWAQDNAAKQQLDSVSAAQSAFIGLSSDPTTAAGGSGTAIQFGDMSTTGAKSLSASGLLPSATKVKIASVGTGSDAHYVAVAKSSSGNLFYITDTKTQPTQANGTGGNANTTAVGGTGNTGGNIPGGTTINGVVFGTAAGAGGTPAAANVALTGGF